MEKTYIFGHRNPDTDSVTAAITLSYLKNQLWYSTSSTKFNKFRKQICPKLF